jgi:hypothetical protein
VYLGSFLTNDSGISPQDEARLCAASNIYCGLQRHLWSRLFSRRNKILLHKSLTHSVWELPTVVRNSLFASPDTSSAPHTVSSNKSSTATQKQPFWTAVLWSGKHCTSSHLPRLYDMLHSSGSRRVASFTDTRNKRRGIQSTQSFFWKEWVISRSKQLYEMNSSGSICITAAIHCPATHPASKDYHPQARLHSRQRHFAHMRCSSGTHAVSPLSWRHCGTRLITAQRSLLWSTIVTPVPVFWVIITINLSGNWQGVLLKKITPIWT